MPSYQLPFDRPDLRYPPPLLGRLRSSGVIHRVRTPTGDEAWLVTGYEEVRTLVTDGRLGLSHPGPANGGDSRAPASAGGPARKQIDSEREQVANARGKFVSSFSAVRMKAMRPRIDELTNARLDELEKHGPPADFQRLVAEPLPSLIICELLGVSYEDRERFGEWTAAAGNTRHHDQARQGLESLCEYGMGLVHRKRSHPGDDLISRMCAMPDTDDATVAQLAMKLLIAGHEATISEIGLGVFHLLAHPAQWRRLLSDPSLVESAVEETLRAPLITPNGLVRYAQVDFEIGGVHVKAGELVLLDNGAANHDPRAFDDPEVFDVTRGDNAHLAFGYGSHYCPGAPLARLELRSVYSSLLSRFPNMRLAVPIADLRLRQDAITSGLVELPVAW